MLFAKSNHILSYFSQDTFWRYLSGFDLESDVFYSNLMLSYYLSSIQIYINIVLGKVFKDGLRLNYLSRAFFMSFFRYYKAIHLYFPCHYQVIFVNDTG
jgi:hypothetical protein